MFQPTKNGSNHYDYCGFVVFVLFLFEGKMAKKKGYSWLSNYVSIAHDTQGWFLDGELGYFRLFWEAANGVVVVCISFGWQMSF